MKETGSNQKKATDFRRIILPVDGSMSSSRAVKKVLSLAKETGADVTALHVIEFPYLASVDLNATYPDIMDIMKKQGNTFLDAVKKQGSNLGVHVKIKLIEGIPDDEIIKEAKKHDLIVMGCRSRDIFDRLLTSSVCEKVLNQSSSSIMTYRVK